jgi:hypothetical protein
MDLHADTIVCGSNCLIMYYTGKECDVSPYTEAHEAIRSVPIVQAATAYNNRDTGKTTILILNEAIRMGDQMEHTLINPNQLRAYGITVQDNPFYPAPIFISTEDNEFTFLQQRDGPWCCNKNPNRPRAPNMASCRPLVRAQVGSTECSVPKSLTNCGGGDFQDSWNCYDSRQSFYRKSRQSCNGLCICHRKLVEMTHCKRQGRISTRTSISSRDIGTRSASNQDFPIQRASFIGVTRRPERTMADWTGAVKGDAKTDDTGSHPIGSNAISQTILCRQDVPDQEFGRQVSIRYDGRSC